MIWWTESYNTISVQQSLQVTSQLW